MSLTVVLQNTKSEAVTLKISLFDIKWQILQLITEEINLLEIQRQIL